jgi:FkbM family methyltransferase
VRTIIVEAHDLKCVVDENARFIVKEAYEPFMKDVVKLRQGDVFVDVGAHVGKYSFYASKRVGDCGIVIAIEPHPKNMINLKKGVCLNGLVNVVAMQKACCNYQGTGFLIEDELSAIHELVQEGDGIKVHVDTLDSILKSLQVKKVNMIKIDVNGCEYEVLQGGRETLMRFKPILIVEVSLENGAKIFEHLEKLGYNPTILSEMKRHWNVMFNFSK